MARSPTVDVNSLVTSGRKVERPYEAETDEGAPIGRDHRFSAVGSFSQAHWYRFAQAQTRQASKRAMAAIRGVPYLSLARFSHDLGVCVHSAADLQRGLELSAPGVGAPTRGIARGGYAAIGCAGLLRPIS